MTQRSVRRRKSLKTFVLGLVATAALLWGANHLIGVAWSALLHWLGVSVMALFLLILCAGVTVFLYQRFIKR